MGHTVQQIGIALVQSRGRWLVGTRAADTQLAGLAEFPGGKTLRSETPRQCAERECAEETGLNVVALRLLSEQQFEYPHASVHLHFWLCELEEPAAAAWPTPHPPFRWVEDTELFSLTFPPANARVLALLRNQFS